MGFFYSPRFSPRCRVAVYAAAWLVLTGSASRAMADGQPLILDTQTGIHDGKSGLVLQNAPLSRAPMVTTQQLAAPEQLNATSGDPPIVVAPYIALPGASGPAPAGANGYGSGYRMRPGNRQ
jgi:hypothetical protein